MKRKRSRQERCEECAYCVLTPSLEKSAYCELKRYAVEMWWQACKDYITRVEITTGLSDLLEEGGKRRARITTHSGVAATYPGCGIAPGGHLAHVEGTSSFKRSE